MSVVFASDIHLEPGRPDISERFFRFLERQAVDSDELYLLGDLFEAWVGDDDDDPFAGEVKNRLRSLGENGVAVFFMHGNRDFLIGDRFAGESGCQLLDDPTPVERFGQTILLSHGDALCTDDTAYQKFRTTVRSPDWQRQFLTRSLTQRRDFARKAQDASVRYQQDLATDIGDVNQQAVQALMDEYQVGLLLHGHTHRPAVHEFTGKNGLAAKRIVLGAWYEQGSMARWDDSGIELIQGI